MSLHRGAEPPSTGDFGTFARGVSFGGGRKRPGNISMKGNEVALTALCANPAMVRLAGF
ncbi:hypothetical protein OH77DRAFT_1522345 [Trametes cingulata]|nr:hypothetical protein OH77DRAFT_1522345 [Trametes cingulata]